MTPEMLTTLADQLAEEIGVAPVVARQALASGDPAMVKLAQAMLKLGNSRDEWHEDMRGHRERILAAVSFSLDGSFVWCFAVPVLDFVEFPAQLDERSHGRLGRFLDLCDARPEPVKSVETAGGVV